MNSDPMLPTSASPVAMPIRISHCIGMVRTPRSWATPTQRAYSLDHVNCSEACETGLIRLLNEWGSPISHDRIANVFIDNTAVVADRLGHH